MGPTPTYLEQLGRLVWLVTEIEWFVIDEPLVADTGFDTSRLLNSTTGQMAGLLEQFVMPTGVKANSAHFVDLAARALRDVARRRNLVLHARPGNRASGRSELWHVSSKNGAQGVWFDEARLGKEISALEYWLVRLKRSSGRSQDRQMRG